MKHSEIKPGQTYSVNGGRATVLEVTRLMEEGRWANRPVKGRKYIAGSWFYRPSAKHHVGSGTPMVIAKFTPIERWSGKEGKTETVVFKTREVYKLWDEHVAEEKAEKKARKAAEKARIERALGHLAENAPKYERFQKLAKDKLGENTSVWSGRDEAAIHLDGKRQSKMDASYVKSALATGPVTVKLTLDQLFALIDG